MCVPFLCIPEVPESLEAFTGIREVHFSPQTMESRQCLHAPDPRAHFLVPGRNEQEATGEQLPSEDLFKLHPDRDGALWVSSFGNVSRGD